MKQLYCLIFVHNVGNGEIAYCDVLGQLGILSNCIHEVIDPPTIVSSENVEEKHEVDFSGFEFDDNDDDNENAISIEQLKQDIMGKPESELDFDKGNKFPVLMRYSVLFTKLFQFILYL